MPPRNTKGNKLLEPKGGCYMHTSSIILGSIVGTIICKQEKFTWSRKWESLFAPRGQSTSCLADPKILVEIGQNGTTLFAITCDY
jgi:hypothetical protein